MPAEVVDGREIATAIRRDMRREVEVLTGTQGRPPGLAVILVGDDLASTTYVRNKGKACEEVGIKSVQIHLPATTSREELLDILHGLNKDETVDGILVQLPLPPHIEERSILEAVDPAKDVDGFHPSNLGGLLTGHPLFVASTPLGIMEVLDRFQVAIEGKDAVVVGWSTIVGKPIAFLLLERRASVTVCQQWTRDLDQHTRQAEILVVAAGKPGLVRGDMVKEGAVVIDVGINRVAGKLVGDVDFPSVYPKASLITPVPGGVGPLTVAMLLKNTLLSYKARGSLPRKP
ncbi:MAG: bifunctional methylenetetrahydrofolate dehydrogenase/methenyltetrahydrofolate cyclohydrolase FolD [candidate division NC10 bacterium]|nr:bifunctional methylenetetrahydrofolate dehydrogenase/methenyltetrahydrofolate cyclohydrolase FolD [candidate division NC10 bacterium]